jgi:hypothetical protein
MYTRQQSESTKSSGQASKSPALAPVQEDNLVAPYTDLSPLQMMVTAPSYLATRTTSPARMQANMLTLQRQVGNRSVNGLIIQRESRADKKRKKFQKKTSTPVPKSAEISRNKATLTINEAKVEILPDATTEDEKLKDRGITRTNFKWKMKEYNWDDEGNITEFEEAPLVITIKTTYGPGAKKSDESGYGRGTTKEDKEAKKTTLGHHEGMHGKVALDYLEANEPPKFGGTVGMSKEDFEAAIEDYLTALDEYSTALDAISEHEVDCVGEKASFCAEEEEEE